MKAKLFTLILMTLAVAGCSTGAAPVDLKPLAVSEQAALQTQEKGLTTSLAPAEGFEAFGKSDQDRSFQTELEFFETVLSYGPAEPRTIFLATAFYLATNQQEYGIAFVERLLKRYENQMDDEARAVHLAAYAILRGTYADRVPLISRISWVLDTFDIIEEAQDLSGGDNVLVRWAAGAVYAQVPSIFGKRELAYENLQWLVARPDREPTPGFFREAYYLLSVLNEDDGNDEQAAHFLKLSGFDEYRPNGMFLGWYTTTKEKGVTFSPFEWAVEIVDDVAEDKVYALRGFGFSEVYFVISKDGKELIVIDAGTQPYSLEAAYNLLEKTVGELPPLTTALVTHAHWDHVGGHTFLKKLNPDITFYGRDNYDTTLGRVERKHTYRQFRGESFTNDWVAGYNPDVRVTETTTITVGGTRFELIPVTGGETEDALIINMPDNRVLFAGDVLMPYYGEPWVEEGFPSEVVGTMDEMLRRDPVHIMHGHFGLTWTYTAEALPGFRDAFVWLRNETEKLLENGYSATDIIRMNLIPPMLKDHPESFVAYITPRTHLIKRIADHKVGIWEEEKTGKEPKNLDTLTTTEYGRMLDLYMNLTASEVEGALQKMLANGDNQLAFLIATAAERRYNKEGITRLREEAADRLRAIAQYIDPFRFVVYTETIGKEHKPIPLEPAQE